MRSAEQEGLRVGNPCAGLKVQDNVRAITRDQVLTEAQLDALKAATPDRYKLILDLLAAGLRMGEVIGLRRDCVNLRGDVRIQRQVVEVAGKLVEGPPKSKNGYRTLPLHHLANDLMHHIDKYAEPTPDGYVFTGRGNIAPLYASTFRKRTFDPAVAAAGLPRITPHDLRHRAACLLADQGFSDVQVAAWLGDSATTVARVYRNVLVNSHERMAQVFNRREVAR